MTQHEQCRLRITILPDAGQAPSGEHKVGVVLFNTEASQLTLLAPAFTALDT